MQLIGEQQRSKAEQHLSSTDLNFSIFVNRSSTRHFVIPAKHVLRATHNKEPLNVYRKVCQAVAFPLGDSVNE